MGGTDWRRGSDEVEVERYRIYWSVREGERIVHLRDEREHATAEIAVSFGMNVVRFAVSGREVVLPPPSFAALRETPFRYGVPVLSPPGRTSYGKFPYRGKTYQLPVRQGEHHMHGEIGTLPWQTVAWGADEERGAFVEACYSYKDDPVRCGYFPFDLQYVVTLRLKDGLLSLDGSVRNGGVEIAPFLLGYHPYFVCDLSRTTLHLPAVSQWPMHGGGVSELPRVTGLAEKLREGAELSELAGNLHILQCGDASATRGGDYVCLLEDRGNGRRIHYRVNGLFAVMVLFMPSWGEAISLEAHSCVPDAVNLPWAADRTGLLELAPTEERRFGWSIGMQSHYGCMRGRRSL